MVDTHRRRLGLQQRPGLCRSLVGLGLLICSSCGENPTPRTQPRAPAETLTAQVIPPVESPVAPASDVPVADDEPDDSNDQLTGRIYRPSDSRPRHNDRRAAELGIHRYESRHLLLYTDIDPDIAATLPPLMDQAYTAWTEYFGELPPNPVGTDYQMTGYIMQDRDRFLAAGMLPPEALQSLVHGIHRGAEFWMNEQEYNYYRRHLMVHEGTHCFMLTMPGPRPPVWYLEGMAEYFGTHATDDAGQARFGVMPRRREDYVGFGRIEMIHHATAENRALTLEEALALRDQDFTESRTDPYAWSWALCQFLDAHPRYQARFRELGQHLTNSRFPDLVRAAFADDWERLSTEWMLFTRNIEYGHDIALAAIDFVNGERLPSRGSIALDVDAAGGWQSSGVAVEQGGRYAIRATGQVVLDDDPEPWISESRGVSIRYAGGKPIGRLLATIVGDLSDSNWSTIDIGDATELTPDTSGTLYFRINDAWSNLANNEGSFRVTIERLD